MSNNISRKGLALGALIAIGASLFAGAPAHAAAGVTLAPTQGTSYNGVVGATFSLTATASSEIPSSSFPTWAVKVTNLNGGVAHVAIGSNAVSTASADIRATDASITVYDTTISNTLAGNNPAITIANTGTASASFQVTTWLDANGNHAVDPSEYSAVQTVNFLGAADLSATTTLSTVPALDTAASKNVGATVVLNNVNSYYVGTPGISVDFRIDNSWDVRDSSWTSLAGHSATVATQSADTRTSFKTADVAPGDSTITARLSAAGSVVSAQAYLGSVKLGAVATSTIGAAGVRTLVLGSIDGNNSVGTVFRKNSTFTVSLTARGLNGAAAAGKTVKVAVDSTGFTTADGRSVTINGATKSNSDDLRANAFSVVTDANGVANVTVTTAGWGSASLSFVATADNATSGSAYVMTPASSLTYTATASVQTGAVVKGGTFQVGVTLKDQFGVGVASGFNAQAQIVGVSTTTGGTADSNTYAPIVNGAATLNIVENGTSTGNVRYAIQASQIDLVNGGYTGSPVSAGNVDLKVRVAQELVSFSQTVATDSARDLANGALTVANGANITNWSYVSGVVSSSTDVRPYATVVVTAAGALLREHGTTNYAVGTITVVANAVGAWRVDVAGNTTGQQAVTVASGSLSTTTNVVFNAPGVNAGTTIINATPAVTVIGGAAGVATVSVRDVYGNQLLTGSLTVRGDNGFYSDVLDAKGYLTIGQTNNATTTVNYVVSYSNDARIITSAIRVVWAKAVVTVTLGDTVTAGQNSDVVVSVQDPAGNAIAGATVSATSTGVGYLTVSSGVTDANGQATLKLYANDAELGWAYVTASVTGLTGNASASSDATGVQVVAADVAPTATDSVAAIALEAAATAQAGTVVDVVATATDADGNPVAGATVAATSTGVGYLAIAGGTTDENGQVVLKLVLSAGQAGDASIVANAGSAQSDAAVVTAGATDANITINKKRVTVDWSFAANKKVVIVRDGVAIKSFTGSSNAADSFSFNLKKGTHKVSVKVGGVTLDSASYKIAK